MGCNQGSQNYFRLYMQKPSRRKKILISEHVSVVNLDHAVMTLPFGGNIDIRDRMRHRDMMKEYNLGSNGGILTLLKVRISSWDQSRTPPSRPYTAWYREYHIGPEWQFHHCIVKVNNIYMFQNKDFLLLDGFSVSPNKYIIRVSK
jgi:hypothetical protein